MNRRVLIAGAVVVAPLLILLAAGLGKDPRAVRTPMVGRVAPPFQLESIDGERSTALAALRGRPVVVNFWATWCVPCYAEHGVLMEGAANAPDVQFVGILYQDEAAKARRFLEQNGSAYQNVLDPGGATAIAYGVYGVPETFFIDSEGRIVAKHEGPLDAPSLASKIALARGVS